MFTDRIKSLGANCSETLFYYERGINVKKFLLLFSIVLFIFCPLNVHAASVSVPSGYEKYGSLSEEYYYDDLELLACLVWAEAGNQDLKGKQLVADVVLNRMYDPRFPDTISDVIYQQGQFYEKGDPRLIKAFYNVTDECFEAVRKEALGEGRIDSRVFFYCAGFFPRYGEIGYSYGDHCFNFF